MGSRIAIVLGCVVLCTAALTAAASKGETGQRFLLLVTADESPVTTDEQRTAIVAEYTAWAGSLHERGHLVAADELAAQATRLTADDLAGSLGPAPAGGYFLIEARDFEQALALSRDCPALRHGGSVELTAVVEH